ncbi:DUF6519 domain-containing protein [Iningainema tapete]|uniref:Uncharacterized protein n=1 Tax=Iningainema tapete BLCC-T55 TaxID=2748662 RepID=A0A8J6XDK5_9CYAN|nr:DUF6519 domain-containing protein [Iningainema tapete]MBD2773364.1 hypothetical protein [Iningainema tapete BLCC-T55]
MQGEFRGDFSRNSFDPHKHFSRVLMQQGRVQLDADWNEQAAIIMHYLRTLAADLIGPHAGQGFVITPVAENDTGFTIGVGHYYVDGILCENENELSYYNQEDYPIKKDTHKLEFPILVYLNVWERHISYIEDNTIREIALNGVDTATRAKIVWQVKTEKLESATSCDEIKPAWGELVEKWQPKNRGMLKARVHKKVDTNTNNCMIHPDARYHGVENQLYRVEIHKGGKADGEATFKWSRENSSIAFRLLKQNGNNLTLSSTGRDSITGISCGQWIELTDDTHELLGKPGTLVKVVKVEGNVLTIDSSINLSDFPRNPKVRRWDYQGKKDTTQKTAELLPLSDDNALSIVEGEGDQRWLTLENGIQIQFQPGATYRTGDYWLIPARTATGDILWKQNLHGEPAALSPHGIEYHYAPLAIVVSSERHSSCRQELRLMR